MGTNCDSTGSDAGTRRPLVLLTGFGPFPGVPHNISGDFVLALADATRGLFPNHDFHAEILPTHWAAGPRLSSTLQATKNPHLVLHFGVASDAQGFRIETQGLNVCRVAPDALGMHPVSAVLAADQDASHVVTIPADAVFERLAELELPVSLSNDAGGFLCNSVLYQSLAAARHAPYPCRIGFIHLPVDLSGPPLIFSDAIRGAIEILRVCFENTPESAANRDVAVR